MFVVVYHFLGLSQSDTSAIYGPGDSYVHFAAVRYDSLFG